MLKNLSRVVASLVLLMALCLSGCAKQLTPEEYAKGDPGPYPQNYQELVKSAMAGVLKDPYSAQYSFMGSPTKRYYSQSILLGGGVTFGWGGFFMINAKNSFGAYVGARKYAYLIRNGAVVMCQDASTMQTE